MKKRILLLLCGVMLICALTACKKEEPQKEPEQQENVVENNENTDEEVFGEEEALTNAMKNDSIIVIATCVEVIELTDAEFDPFATTIEKEDGTVITLDFVYTYALEDGTELEILTGYSNPDFPDRSYPPIFQDAVGNKYCMMRCETDEKTYDQKISVLTMDDFNKTMDEVGDAVG